MPDARIYGPVLDDVAVKRVLVKEITDALEKAYQIPRKGYVVTVVENQPENVAIGGILNIDNKSR